MKQVPLKEPGALSERVSQEGKVEACSPGALPLRIIKIRSKDTKYAFRCHLATSGKAQQQFPDQRIKRAGLWLH
jgi:hypothetical protein